MGSGSESNQTPKANGQASTTARSSRAKRQSGGSQTRKPQDSGIHAGVARSLIRQEVDGRHIIGLVLALGTDNMSLHYGKDKTDLPDADWLLIGFDRRVNGLSRIRFVKVVNDE